MTEEDSGKGPNPIFSACMKETSRVFRFDRVNLRRGRSRGKTKNWYDISRDVVVFWGQDRTQRIGLFVSREALDGHIEEYVS
jgi:hypothetical protein